MGYEDKRKVSTCLRGMLRDGESFSSPCLQKGTQAVSHQVVIPSVDCRDMVPVSLECRFRRLVGIVQSVTGS